MSDDDIYGMDADELLFSRVALEQKLYPGSPIRSSNPYRSKTEILANKIANTSTPTTPISYLRSESTDVLKLELINLLLISHSSYYFRGTFGQ